MRTSCSILGRSVVARDPKGVSSSRSSCFDDAWWLLVLLVWLELWLWRLVGLMLDGEEDGSSDLWT